MKAHYKNNEMKIKDRCVRRQETFLVPKKDMVGGA